jgi:hypothetical protein
MVKRLGSFLTADHLDFYEIYTPLRRDQGAKRN